MSCRYYRASLHQTQQCRQVDGRYKSNLVFHNTSVVPQADRLHAMPLDAVIHAKGALKLKVLSAYVYEHTFQYADISVLKIISFLSHFIGLM